MKKLADIMDYEKFKNAKNLSDMLGQIPAAFFETSLFYLLCIYCLSPVFIVVLLNLGITFFNLEFLLFQVGYVAIMFTWLLGYKRFSERSQKESLKKSIVLNLPYLFLGSVIVWAILSTLFSSNIEISFFGDYYRKEGLLTIGAYAGIFSGILSIHGEKLKFKIIQIFILAAAFLGVVVILQYCGFPIKSVIYQFGINDDKPFILWAGIFHNINHYGYYLSLAVMAAGGLFIFETRKVGLALYGLCFILLAGVLVANNTFGSYLGVLAGLLALTGVCIYRKEKVKRVIFLLVIFFAVSLIINVAMGTVKNNFTVLAGDVKNISQFSNESATSQTVASVQKAGSGRWQLWMGALKIMEENPLFGTGPDNMAISYTDLGLNWDRPHNEFLQIGASLGIPALIFYVLALGFGYGKALRNLKKLSSTTIIALGACTGYLVSSLFGNTMYYTTPYFLIFLGIAFSKTPLEVTDEPYQKISV